MKRCSLHLLALATGAMMWAGCEETEPVSPQATPVPSAPVAVNITQPKAGATAPPPVAGVHGTAPPAANQAPPSPDGPLENLVAKGNIFFYDDDGNFLAKDGVDFLQRAVRSYLDAQKYKSDDSPDWPPMTDLSLLVQYKVVKALPTPPHGQRYVLDPQTRKVQLAGN